MKNQYLGDVGDYGKFSLLRHLAQNGIRIGVNWYHTKDNPLSNDGKINRYLWDDTERMYDPAVFDAMRKLAFEKEKSISDIRMSELIPNAIYFEDELSTDEVHWKERQTIRDRWHQTAMDALAEAELIFADPDTGVSEKVTRKGSQQYARPSELADYYKRGQDVVYYCHRARHAESAWNEKKGELLALVPDAAIFVLTFHRGTQRSFIFAVHPSSEERYRKLTDSFLDAPWGMGVCGRRAPFEETYRKESGC